MATKYPEWIKTKSQRMMHNDFRLFLWYIWKHLNLPPPTEIQNDIAAYIQGGPRRRIIQAFRGIGKSWITAAYVLWLLYRDPQWKILVVSASKERADAFSIFVKRLIHDVDILQFLAPKAGQRDSNIAFDVGPATPDQSPSVRSAGITSQITGSRADVIVSDDVEIPNNSGTEDQREKLISRTDEFDAILKPHGQIVVLGTPQTEQSLYSVLRGRGYETRIWPARFTQGLDDDGNDKYAGCLAPYITKRLAENSGLNLRSTEPERFSDEDLAEREGSRRSWFALQFMLDTSLNDANRFPLKISDLMVMDLDKEIAPVQLTWASGHQQVIEEITNVGLNADRCHRPMYVSEAHVKYQGSVMIIDPAGRGKDETSYAVVKMLNGQLFCTAWGGIQGHGYEDATLTALALIAKEHSVNEIMVEANFGDGMFNALFAPILRRIFPVTLDEYKVSIQKEVRVIQKLEPVLNQHRLVMDKAVAIANSTLDGAGSAVRCGLYQMTHLTKEKGALKHDDRVDVLAEACAYWIERLDVDSKDSEDKWKADQKQEALNAFMKVALGKSARRFKNFTPQR